MLQRFDSNHDGVISLVEYRAGTLANFDKLDTDKDGVVTPAEMKAGGLIKH
jgi:Ca2+-binding EF-hand superfamily protein